MFKLLFVLFCVIVQFGPSSSTLPSYPVSSEDYGYIVMSYAAYAPRDKIQPFNCPPKYCSNNLSMSFFDDFKVNEVFNYKNDLFTLFGGEIQYYFATKGTTVYLVFRGTSNLENDLSDLFFNRQAEFPLGQGWDTPDSNLSKIAEGFDIDFALLLGPGGLEKNIKSYTDLCFNVTGIECNFVITGHSLGAAVASALHCTFHKELLNLTFSDMSVYNFGSPRVGNEHFATLYNSFVPNTFRFVNQNDFIPHMAFAHVETNVNFVHVNTEVWLTSQHPNEYPVAVKCSANSGEENHDYHSTYFGINHTQLVIDFTDYAVEVTPSPSMNPFRFPVLSQVITDQTSPSQGVTYSTVVGRFNNTGIGATDIDDPVFISSPNIVPIGMVGLRQTNVNGIINWRLSPAGGYTQFMAKNSYIDFSYTIQSSEAMTFTRIK
eukprot:gene15285-18096_t